MANNIIPRFIEPVLANNEQEAVLKVDQSKLVWLSRSAENFTVMLISLNDRFKRG